MALLDDIKARLAQAGTQPAAPAGSAQAAAQAIFRAKTGKAAGQGGAPAASNLGEQLAVGQVQAQQGQIAGQAAQVAAGLSQGEESLATSASLAQAEQATKARQARAGIASGVREAAADRAAKATDVGARLSARETQATRELTSRYSEGLKALASQRNLTVDDLFTEHQASTKTLAQRRDAAQLEQKAFQLRLSNQAYVDQLKQIGAQRRLGSDLEFKQELTRQALGDQLTDLLEGAKFKLDLQADQTKFETDLKRLNVDLAWDILQRQTKDANTQMIFNTLAGAGKAGASYRSDPAPGTQRYPDGR